VHQQSSALAGFKKSFDHVMGLLHMGDASDPSLRGVAWKTLIKRAVEGTDVAHPDLYEFQEPAHRASLHTAVEDLMRDLEGWSLELQRHCPNDWNQCSAILVQCLNHETQKKQAVSFEP